MKIRIANYRNIPFEYPLEFELKDGITFILGPNNVGKSNLINFFYDFRSIFVRNNFDQHSQPGMNFKLDHVFFDQLLCRNTEKDRIYLEISNDKDHTVCYEIFSLKSGTNHTKDVGLRITLKNVRVNTSELRDILDDIENLLKKTFIIGVYRTPLMIASGDSLDLNIGSAFINTWAEWADGGDIGKMKKIKQLKDELKVLFNYSSFDIRIDKDKSNFIVTNDDGEFLLKELGSGIGQFILILATALMKTPSYILIDEPEISLHPKMQEIFVRALAAKSERGLLAVSHSIALARSVSDRIYTLVKNENSRPKILPYGQHYQPTISQSINEMSYSQYVEIGGNNILLVEGRTDIKSFREILRKYELENKFIILSFGGSQFMTKEKTRIVEELQEIKRLNPNSINVIFDSEKTSETAMLKNEFKIFKETCEELGFNVFSTDKHSTENYISQAAISKVVGNQYCALSQFENFKTVQNKWPKEKNWLMFLEMEKDDFLGTQLDEFIQTTLRSVSTIATG
ncbi:MAG: AAA family ATPase [Chitinophagaceae bacterium]